MEKLAIASRRRFLRSSVAFSAGLGLLQRESAIAAPPSKAERLFELGTVTYNIAKDWDLETLIAKCEKLDLKAVELRTTHKHGVEPTLSEQQRTTTRERFEKSNVRLLSLGTVCEFHSPTADVVKQNIATARQFIKLAHDLGALGIKVRPNGLPTETPAAIAATLKQIGHSLQEVGEYAAGLGVEVWVEVHGKGTAHPPHMRTMLDACKHPSVGVTWNSNPTDVKEGTIREAFDLLAKDIRCVHINELWNGYPYRELFDRLRGIGYDRYTLIEIADNPDPDRLLRYYRKLWDELSQPK